MAMAKKLIVKGKKESAANRNGGKVEKKKAEKVVKDAAKKAVTIVEAVEREERRQLGLEDGVSSYAAGFGSDLADGEGDG